ncbi:hypothetical protein KAF25_008983 [Fusarium avenaceum]|uniref:Uncharacterized protein n=1 Tax=Fusarium avenaceum TaxID=40199 RepID=A0A9P7H029_9HYPO|nr:hypothetical protein KAF25_008983 [Fusarium avenaceum]
MECRSDLQNCGICYTGASPSGCCPAEQPESHGSPSLRA